MIQEELSLENFRFWSDSTNPSLAKIMVKVRHETVINGQCDFIKQNTLLSHMEDINVQLSTPQMFSFKDSSLEYTLYIIEITKEGRVMRIGRRYSDFLDFHKSLIAEFGYRQVPTFPKKKWFGNLDPSFIDIRKKELEIYFYDVINDPLLYKSDQVKDFMANPLKM